MSSLNYSTDFEDSLNFFKIAQDFYKRQDYQRAHLYLERAIEKTPPYPQIYILKALCGLNTQNFKETQLDIDTGLRVLSQNQNNETDDSIHRLKFLSIRHNLNKHIHNWKQAADDLKSIKGLLSEKDRLFSKAKLNEISEEINLNLSALAEEKGRGEIKRTKAERMRESCFVADLIKESHAKRLLSREFSLVHLISMSWFQKWSKYTYFDETTRSEDNNSENREDLDDNEEDPGPINSDDILERVDNMLIDPDTVKEYCNYVLKTRLLENRDFVIVSHPVWKYLHYQYSGKDIKRYVISINDDSNATDIELWLKKINVLICPVIQKSQDYSRVELNSVFISKKETIKDLREKITRTLKKNYEFDERVNPAICRLWKLEPQSDYKDVIKKVQDTKESLPINGKRLSESTVLEDAEISDNDILVCEYKIDNKWKFGTLEETTKMSLMNCGFCGKSSDSLLFCECKTVKYCDANCQRNHRPQHKEKCNTIKNSMSKTNDIMRQFKISKTKFTPSSRYGLTGLQNLGNTCFMNSSLQCLSNIYELTTYFLNNDFLKDLNKENRLGTGGRLAAIYAELMKELWHGSEAYISPWDIKKIISEIATQFSGYNQQDAQEFLSYVLDGIHEDLNKITQKPYIEAIESDNKPDEVLSKESWENHLKRNQSIIVDMMHGQYKSKLVCPDCKKISITFDPFVSVPLPLPAITVTSFAVYFIYKNSKTMSNKINLQVTANSTVEDILVGIAKVLNVPVEAMDLKLLKDNAFVDEDVKSFNGKMIKEHEGMPFVYQLYDEGIDGDPITFFNAELINFEIQIRQQNRTGEDSTASFSRAYTCEKSVSLQKFHQKIYASMRGYLNHSFANEENGTPLYRINIEDFTETTILEEYKTFLELDNQTKRPYCLFTKRKNKFVEIPYSGDSVESFFGDLKNDIQIQLIWNIRFRVDTLKLNKCQEFGSTITVGNTASKYSIYDCFDLFTKEEILDKENCWYCSKCKDHKQASKKMDIYKVPKILLLCLKRFKTSRVHSIGSFYFTGGSSKISSYIDFPLEGLNLEKFILGKTEVPPIYDLFAVVNHFGSLGGGHYTAYCKNHEKNAWYDFNDSSVSKQDQTEIVSEAAYLLFYRLRSVQIRV